MPQKEIKRISRREFLKDAGLIVGGATIGSIALVNACASTTTTTATTTVTGTTTATSIGTTTVPITTTSADNGNIPRNSASNDHHCYPRHIHVFQLAAGRCNQSHRK